MDNPDKFIDLPPQEWRSEREKPHEPFFGPGLPVGIGIAISIGLATWAHEMEFGWFGQASAGLLGALIGGVIHQFRS